MQAEECFALCSERDLIYVVCCVGDFVFREYPDGTTAPADAQEYELSKRYRK